MELRLRPWKMEDADRLARHANNYNIARFLTDAFPHPYSYDDAVAFLTIITKVSPPTVMAIEVDGEVVGAISVTPQTDIHCKNAEMGYYVFEEYWGRGIMTRAIREMLDYGFRTFDVTRIFARPFATNGASQKVLEKSGFVLEARFPKALYKNGEFIDELYYGMTRERFECLQTDVNLL